MPTPRTPEQVLRESFGEFYKRLFGVDKELFREYVDMVSQFGDGRSRGVKKE